MLREAASRKVQIACLPELFRSQYFCQSEDAARFDLAEPIPGPTTEALTNVARETGMVVVGSIFERRTAGIYHNTAVVIDAEGTLRGRYRKMHIPDDPLYYEKYYFTPGDLGFQAFETTFARIGTLVCWDQWYPEAARLTALRGAEILFYPTAIGWHPAEKAEFGPAQSDAWETMQRAHAIANGVYVAAVNRIGHEGVAYWRPGVLGRIIYRRSIRPDHRPRRAGHRGDRHRHLRSPSPGRNPAQLAVLSRPSHRCLRPHHSAVHRSAMTSHPRQIPRPPPVSATGCPRNGSHTPRPGSPGPTTTTTGRASFRRFPGSTLKSLGTSAGSSWSISSCATGP